MTNLFLLAEDSTNSGSSWIILAVLAVLLIGTMLLSIIPQRKRQKKAQEMMAGIKVGSKIKTIGGFVGIVMMIDASQGTFVLDISANGDGSVLVTIDRNAVYTVINPATEGSADGAAAGTDASANAQSGPVAADDVVEDAQSAEKKAAKKSRKKKDEEAETVQEDSVEKSDSTNIDGDNSNLTF